MKKIFAMLLSAAMIVSLAAGCAETGTKEPENSDSTVTPVSEPENKIGAGTFSFTYVDDYGDETAFTVTTKETGKVYVKYEGALGSATLNGDGWTDNGDGTFTTNALSGEIGVDWVGADGKVTWKVDGENVVPVGYTAPTQFLAKPYTDPVTAAEAVGIYTFGYVNGYGVTVPYVLWLNADGTFRIFENSGWVGLMEYYGDSWTINGDSVVSLGACSYDGEPPRTEGNGATWFAEGTYESSWKLSGDKTCVPIGYDGKVGELDLTELPAECYPAGADKVGIYTFAFFNSYGATVPYVVWINADQTANIFMQSAWVGVQEYVGHHWALNDDGTVTISDMTYEGEPPKTDGNGATWFADDTYESTWELSSDKTCKPVNYDGKIGEFDLAELPQEIYPTAVSAAGTYYFGFVNPYGATTPYAVKLKEDGTALIIMDNSWVGAQSYVGNKWVENEDGTITISDMTYEGEAPKTAGNGATWFADDTYESTWVLDGGSCVPANYDGKVDTIDRSSFSDGAISALEAF